MVKCDLEQTWNRSWDGCLGFLWAGWCVNILGWDWDEDEDEDDDGVIWNWFGSVKVLLTSWFEVYKSYSELFWPNRSNDSGMRLGSWRVWTCCLARSEDWSGLLNHIYDMIWYVTMFHTKFEEPTNLHHATGGMDDSGWLKIWHIYIYLWWTCDLANGMLCYKTLEILGLNFWPSCPKTNICKKTTGKKNDQVRWRRQECPHPLVPEDLCRGGTVPLFQVLESKGWNKAICKGNSKTIDWTDGSFQHICPTPDAQDRTSIASLPLEQRWSVLLTQNKGYRHGLTRRGKVLVGFQYPTSVIISHRIHGCYIC